MSTKSKISIGLVVLLVVMSLSNVFAVNYIMNLSVSYNGKTIASSLDSDGHSLSSTEAITLKNTDTNRTLTVTTDAKYVDSSLTIYKRIGTKDPREAISTGKKSTTFDIPTNLEAGKSYWVSFEAVSNNTTDNYIGNSNIFYVKVTVPSESTPTPEQTTAGVALKDGTKYITAGSTLNRKAGDTLVVEAESNKGIKQICYKWNGGSLQYISGSLGNITVPSGAADSIQTLELTAETTDGKWAPAKTYYVRLPLAPSTVEKADMTFAKDGNDVVVTPKIENGVFKKFTYKWDNDAEKESTQNPLRVAIPTAIGTHVLTVRVYTNNDVTAEKQYTYEVKPVVPTNDDLIVEDWMKENKDLEGLVVSLRNDSDEYEKKNKNIYALKEEVVYYVDYKNGGKDINQEVRLVLELPLEHDVVDSFGGTVDKDKKTITWVFENGLEKGQAGTKVVKIKYTSLGKGSRRSETIYPSAKIYQGTSKSPKDVSTVINFIFKDEDTEIAEDHYPYMYGDANSTTFRPDDTITRAEGALVLARIFGINYSGTTVVGNEFADLDETYIEAQKAIVASTKMGLINGYPDGTYKPNNKMTKAEFMKIIAAYVERRAEDDNIKGLEIKDIENSIKMFRNTTNVYVTGNSTTSDHWAITYVTLLARINMTPASSKSKSIGLDDEITRAEVAQLVNYYLLRAPAENGKTSFSDVAKNHKLFADIVEATRPAHSFTLTSEGTEVAVKD